MTQNKRTNIANILVIVGMIMMIVMAVTPLLVNHQLNMEWMRWIFIAGALIVLVGRLIDIYRGPSQRLKRLHVILVFSALLYCASGSMMFIFQGTNNWIAFLLAGVMVQLYASWMIDREQSKNKQ
jgi:UDP-N-acetylmuramyl pentapeptide phosphotransferase/UDP-N-acetylglucosamine-1-phosphate transferase